MFQQKIIQVTTSAEASPQKKKKKKLLESNRLTGPAWLCNPDDWADKKLQVVVVQEVTTELTCAPIAPFPLCLFSLKPGTLTGSKLSMSSKESSKL